MRIRSVSVENFGTIGAVDLELGGGMTVICGPNESGKSTLQRAIWFALTRRATSQAEEIREIEPNGGGTPRVEVELDGAEGTYAVEKTFAGQSGSTTLRADRDGMVDTYSGEEAGEKLRGVLGFGEISGRPPTPDHTGFWPVTWVRQEESGSDPGEKLSEEGNEATVSEALAEIGGDVLAGSEGGDLIEKAREEYGRFFTPNGNKTTRSGAPLHEAEKRLEEAEEKLRRLEEKQREYERDLEEFSRLQSEITGLEEEQIPGLKEDAEAARKAHSRLEELRGTLGRKEAELETAETKLEQAEGRLSRREELQEEIDTLSDEVEGLEETVSLKAEDLNAHREQRESLVETKKSVEERHGEMRSRVNLLEAHVDVLRLEDRLGELNESLETVQGHEEELEDVRKELAEIQIFEEDIEALEAQKEERDRAEVELETAAAQVRLSAHEDVEVTEGEDTSTLQAGEESEHLVDEPTTFSVDGVLDIRVEPGGEGLADIRSRLEEAQQAYEETLSEHGVDSLSEARTRQREKDDLSGQEERLESLIDQATPDGGREALEEERREVSASLNAAREKRDGQTDEEIEVPETVSEAEEELQTAQEELGAVEEELDAAKEELSGHDAETTELKQAKNLAEQELSGKQDELQGAKETLEEHKSQHGPSGDLRAEVESAEEKRDRLEEEVGELREELQELDPGQVEQEKERAEDALENARESLRERENDLSELRGRLTSSDLRGLHERLEGAREEAETARAEVERWERKAQAAKRLYETLSECRSEAQKEHLTPLRNEVETLLGRFFADESPRVEFEEDFGIARLSRSSDGSFEFGQLSAGAREQLGLLIRLGMARLVGKEAHHPVFLDEPLADTDSDRFDLIAQVLREMAEDLQLIVTTCHRDRYRRLGVRIVDLPRKKREAEMA
ncbi:DNA repair exonuclease SbcCD ATPase subunit [Salinibacter ruber]|uniref:AAA family ATPase n=1 Tax=Salinibacter ruber TaxID=146919 RepID=UPI00216A9ED4|nr:SMC family ATPase [Salinibacter ruber]MCS3668707.1 DNA repair exonuclease SbcCD ATPase subunit [Salinibacter ruber]